MRRIIIVAFVVIFTSLLNLNLKAQGHYPVIAMKLQTTAVSGNMSNGQPEISDSTIFNIVMKIVISDTASINNLQVSLQKSISEPAIIFSKTFSYDVSGTFSDGTSYSRIGYEITLNLGNFMGTINPYSELIVANISGNTTDPISYN